MCQTLGTCYIEDPWAREKDAINEAEWFLRSHPEASYEELKSHLIKERKYVSPQVLRPMIANALEEIEKKRLEHVREAFYRKMMALLPSE